ncbi:MAG: efflux RND transporter periplasmic adaptor subunit [Planctomycetota bacterium]
MSNPIRIAGLTLRYLAPLLLIVFGVVAARALAAQRKAPPKVEAPPSTTPVETVTAALEDHTWTLPAYGTVRALREVTLRPTVTGPVTGIHPNLIAGGRVAAGDVLVRIDPRDYELGVASARASLATAEADLEVERGNQAVARRELELLAGEIELDADERRLALREPIVAQREASVETARTQLSQAELDLERCNIVAPFDAVVTSETVETGAFLGAGNDVCTLVATETFVVEVSVPRDQLAGLAPVGAAASVWPTDAAPAPRAGRLARLLPEVDGEGRTARIQVEVDAPLAPGAGGDASPLLLSSFARVELPLQPVTAAIALPRAALREGPRVWLVDDEGRLEFRDVTVHLRGAERFLVTEGLVGGERVITSTIGAPVPSMRVAPIDPNTGAPDAGTPERAPWAAPAAAPLDADGTGEADDEEDGR